MGEFLTAQVCMNGHTITEGLELSPDFQSKFCSTCGAQTISECQNCSTPIRGEYYIPGVIASFDYIPPNYCHDCGKSMPWLEQSMASVTEIIKDLNELPAKDHELFIQTVLELTKDTPRTELAALRYRKYLTKFGKVATDLLNKTVHSIATDAAKRLLDL